MKAIIVGAGNTIVRDDGVGIYISRMLKKSLHHPGVKIKETSLSGITYIDMLEGFDFAFIIDSIKLENDDIGELYKIEEGEIEIEYKKNPQSLHLFTLWDAVSLGRKIGLKMPDKIIVYAVNVSDNTTFNECFSPEIQNAIQPISENIKKDIQKYLSKFN